jgi:hypothetical protein
MSKKERIIGWVIIIVAVIISFTLSLRGMIFDGQPFDSTHFTSTAIIAGVAIFIYARGSSREKKKKD